MKRHLSFVTALGIGFFASISAAHAQVRVDTGSIAIGGSVTSSTVIIGIPQEKVDELVRDAKRPLEELTTQQRENIAAAGGCGQIVLVGQLSGYASRHGGGIVRSQSQ
jgi:hypothetical protein